MEKKVDEIQERTFLQSVLFRFFFSHKESQTPML
uniref:Uncharacterized protein n=1 Tax=Vitis vinifera TaxID=29760 RepID=F6HBT9_VITVI